MTVLTNRSTGAREIMELQVWCSSHERGCQWTGTVRTLDDHTNKCQFSLVSCPNKCGEPSLMRMEVLGHLQQCPFRDHVCEGCGKKGTYISMQDHDDACDEVVIPCPNKKWGCLISMKRGQMDHHLKNECECAQVGCVYENLGCAVRMMRRDMIKHQENDDKHHLYLALGKTQVASPGERCITLEEKELFTFKLTEYSTKKKTNEIFQSEPFYTHSGGYKMCVVVYPNGIINGEFTHLSVRIKILQGKHDKALLWPFCGYMDCELLNQVSNDHHHCLAVYFDQSSEMLVGSCKGTDRFCSHSVLNESPSRHVQYLLKDALHFRVSVKARYNKMWLNCKGKTYIERHMYFSRQ